MSENNKPQSTPLGTKPKSLRRKLANMVLRRHKPKFPGAEQTSPPPEPHDNTITPYNTQQAVPETANSFHAPIARPELPSPPPSPWNRPVVKTPPLHSQKAPSSTPEESTSGSEDLEFLMVDCLLESLRVVDLCQENGGAIGKEIAWILRDMENTDTKVPLGGMEDAWYAWQPCEAACRAKFRVRTGAYPQVWEPPTIIRLQRRFHNDRGRGSGDDANGITCYQLGSIWASKRETRPPGQQQQQQQHEEHPPPPPPPLSGPSLLSRWEKTWFKLMVEMKESAHGEEATGSPAGAVWVVNHSGYDKANSLKRATTKLERVLVARIADSLQDLLDGKRGRWPKFEEADADYLEYYPCYQREEGGPILWKTAADDDCLI